ncbi:MAG: hypothetical protein G8237_06670, partial [Magnetococcales bacterium]|nr:hypothetical protein [Magnetococcales bacterium]
DLLAEGPLSTKTVDAEANGAGYSKATIRRAKKALKIKPSKDGMTGGWVCQIPGQQAAKAILENTKMLKDPEGAQHQELSTFEEIEHLRGDHCHFQEGNIGNPPFQESESVQQILFKIIKKSEERKDPISALRTTAFKNLKCDSDFPQDLGSTDCLRFLSEMETKGMIRRDEWKGMNGSKKQVYLVGLPSEATIPILEGDADPAHQEDRP